MGSAVHGFTGLFTLALLGCRPSPEAPIQQGNLGIVLVDTHGVVVDERTEDRAWVDVDLNLIEGSDSAPASIDGAPNWSGVAAIHIRGNSSAQYPKKQYALETRNAAGEDVDISPFGLPEEEDWVLHAPYSDKTLMRNHLMFHWARAIGRYAPRTHFVELYMEDGGDTLDAEDYRGVYLLIEKIKRDKNRVDIDKLTKADNQLPALSGGYLLRRDWIDGEALMTERYEDELLLEHPKPEDITDSQRDYIARYLNDFESALAAENGSAGEYADLDSFADHMLMMELSRNVDAYVLSTFMHKPREGLLRMGPIWDFNGSLGNADYFESWESEGWHYENSEFPGDNPNGFHWYTQLLKDPDFQQRLSSRWTTHRAGVWSDETLLADIDQTAALLNAAQSRNFERWPVLGEHVWPNDFGAGDRHSYAEEITYLKEWLIERTAWLDTQWLTPSN